MDLQSLIEKKVEDASERGLLGTEEGGKNLFIQYQKAHFRLYSINIKYKMLLNMKIHIL